jgi:hypothetical protein
VPLTVIGDSPERAHAEKEAARSGGISLMKRLSQAMMNVL